MTIKKTNGHIDINEVINQIRQRPTRDWLIILREPEDGGHCWWGEKQEYEDAVTLFEIEEGCPCPVCGKPVPSVYCGECGAANIPSVCTPEPFKPIKKKYESLRLLTASADDCTEKRIVRIDKSRGFVYLAEISELLSFVLGLYGAWVLIIDENFVDNYKKGDPLFLNNLEFLEPCPVCARHAAPAICSKCGFKMTTDSPLS